MSTTEDFTHHVEELARRSIDGDTFAAKSLSALALLATGWRNGDPDPVDGPDGDGGVVVDLASYRAVAA